MSSLSRPEEYLCQVLRTFYQVKKIHGDVIVRIGITGQGKMPHYRIDGMKGTPIQAFDYLGEPFPNYRPVDTEAWSTAFMTFSGLQQLLGNWRRANRAGRRG